MSAHVRVRFNGTDSRVALKINVETATPAELAAKAALTLGLPDSTDVANAVIYLDGDGDRVLVSDLVSDDKVVVALSGSPYKHSISRTTSRTAEPVVLDADKGALLGGVGAEPTASKPSPWDGLLLPPSVARPVSAARPHRYGAAARPVRSPHGRCPHRYGPHCHVYSGGQYKVASHPVLLFAAIVRIFLLPNGWTAVTNRTGSYSIGHNSSRPYVMEWTLSAGAVPSDRSGPWACADSVWCVRGRWGRFG